MRPPAEITITPDEEELIKKGLACEEFIQQPLWKEIEKFSNDFVENALNQMRGNVSSDPATHKHFQNIWREREVFRDSLILFVKGPIKAKTEFLKQIEEMKKQIEEEKQYGRSAY